MRWYYYGPRIGHTGSVNRNRQNPTVLFGEPACTYIPGLVAILYTTSQVAARNLPGLRRIEPKIRQSVRRIDMRTFYRTVISSPVSQAILVSFVSIRPRMSVEINCSSTASLIPAPRLAAHRDSYL